MGHWGGISSSNSIQTWKRCMSLIQRCSDMRQLKPTHALFIASGIHRNTYAISKLIAFCAVSDSGSLRYASLLFTLTQNPNSFIYNTLIRAHSRSSHPQNALSYFRLMVADPSVVPNQHTYPFVLAACANLRSISAGQQIHSTVFKNGLAFSDNFVQTALLRMYAEGFVIEDARKVFDEIPHRDVVLWNVILNGYLRCSLSPESLHLFRAMLLSNVEPDEFCVATGLTACAYSGALRQGTWIHEYIKKKRGFKNDVFVGTALVDMYAKCGCIDKAVEAFEEMPERNVFSWAAIINGFAMHGFAKEAMDCLERMQKMDGLRPDGVVLLGALTACTHAGLEKEGLLLLNNMETRYCVAPKHEHYSCTVDLLCRAGKLDEALRLIEEMPMRPLASVWGSLLSGSRIQGNVELAELAVDEIERLEHEGVAEEDDGVYVQLSNVYLGASRRDDARKIRKMMGSRGIKKTPGCSVIEVDGDVSEFVAGDVVHPLQLQIHAMLHLLSHSIKGELVGWADSSTLLQPGKSRLEPRGIVWSVP